MTKTERRQACGSGLGRMLLPIMIGALLVGSAHSCGPFFPLWMLGSGDEAVLTAPVCQFTAELTRLGLSSGPHPEGQSPKTETIDLELEDLQRALIRLPTSSEKTAHALAAWKKFRAHFPLHSGGRSSTTQTPTPLSLDVQNALQDLPPEFVDYAQGVAAWAQNIPEEAHEHWTRLLQRPESERREKSVWAAYMLGRIHSYDEMPVEEVNAYYQKTRGLAEAGFSDSQGLAIESLGWEAQVLLNVQDYEAAMPLYLQQLSRGDASAPMSLYMAASKALMNASDEDLVKLIQNTLCRKVITAYTISDQSRYQDQRDGLPPFGEKVKRWLIAAEKAGVTDLASAETLAVAAYRAGEDKLARRWILRAPRSLTSQWLVAKLWIKAGDLNKACESLRTVARSFPRESRHSGSLIHNLMLSQDEDGDIRAASLIQGELGVLLLARKEYTEALHALIVGDFWMDAAYVAERVLTLGELQRYVNTFWREQPAVDLESITDPEEKLRSIHHGQIRALLARRMFREGQGRQAIPYLPERLRATGSELVQQLDLAYTDRLPKVQRAEAWWKAARLARWNGMEVLATEVEPDWAYHGGSYEAGVNMADRKAHSNAVTRATSDELQRAGRHAVDPEERYHYRFLAAAMAWEAAKLMPDQSPDTALILATSGSWIKSRAPKTADSFYKALAKRCSQTELGKEANRRRWFPVVTQDDEASVTFR